MVDIDKAARDHVIEKCSWSNSTCFLDGVGCYNCTAPYKVFMSFIYEAYKTGGKFRQPEIDELIEIQRWRDVDIERPNNGDVVQVRYKFANETEEYGVARYHDKWTVKAFLMRGKQPKYITHWRPIDTPKATQLLEKYGKKSEEL